MTLSQIGHSKGIVNYYFYRLGKYNDINAQIISAARKHPSGDFGYSFNNAYGFEDYLFSFGGGVVAGVFIGTVKHENGMMLIDGTVQYFYDDVFTDPLDIRSLYDDDPKPEEMWWIEQITEFGGNYFPIFLYKEYWKTSFRAEVRIFAGASIYHWENQ